MNADRRGLRLAVSPPISLDLDSQTPVFIAFVIVFHRETTILGKQTREISRKMGEAIPIRSFEPPPKTIRTQIMLVLKGFGEKRNPFADIFRYLATLLDTENPSSDKKNTFGDRFSEYRRFTANPAEGRGRSRERPMP